MLQLQVDLKAFRDRAKSWLRASAIRYYEQIGILEPARRVGGQRRYDDAVLYRLAVVRRAQEAGFTLDEIRQLFCGFSHSNPISRFQSMRTLLKKLETSCECETVERCGPGILGITRATRPDPAQ